MSTFTPNKNIEQPAHGAYNDDWDVPVNNNSTTIDTAFGGTTSISVTGVTGPYIGLTSPQYTPPNFEFTGTLSANLYYIVPATVGGLWSLYNNTTGTFQLAFNTAGGTSVVLPQGYRTFCVSDGVNMRFADDGPAATAQAAAEAYAQTAANTAQTNAEMYAAVQASAAQANAQAFAANGSNINAGTVANTHLPLIGLMGGVTIAPDPGTTPSGVSGQMFFYY